MADFDSSLPIRTEADGDVVAQIGGKSDPSLKWEIDSDGRGFVNVIDAGGNELVLNADGSVNVVILAQAASDEVHIFGTTVAGVPSTENTVVDYTVTGGKTLMLKAIEASASGKFKFELKTGPGASELTRAVGFGSVSTGTVEIVFPQPIEVDAGDKVLLLITNRDKANADVYGFINGNEV